MNTFQHNIPVFVISEFTASGKRWLRGKHFPWLEMKIPVRTVQILFNQGFVKHNPELEKKYTKIGDGLEELDKEQLHALVDKINDAVKRNTAHKTEFTKKKCPKSNYPDKQRGHIRRWRYLYGELENK